MHFIISCSYTCKYRPNGWANPLHPGKATDKKA